MTSSRVLRFGFVILAVAILLASVLGTVDLSPARILRVTLSGLGLADASDIPETDRNILLAVRYPRVCLLALVGGALGIVGATLQATFQNPMADPGILGVTGGGAFGAMISIYLGWADQLFLALPACAFAGALAGSILVFGLAHIGGRPSNATFLLIGIAVGTLAAAGMSLVLAATQEYQVKQILFWLVGGAEGRTWRHVELAAPPILFASAGLMVCHRFVDTLTLGEEHALSVGVPVSRARLALIVLCALAAGAAVSVAGSIAFVGLIIPHAVRRLVGSRARTLLPACFLGGAAFLVLCDLGARLLSRAFVFELNLGILTAFLGVPFLLGLIFRGQRQAT
jgi:iron complex transport system permease protein